LKEPISSDIKLVSLQVSPSQKSPRPENWGDQDHLGVLHVLPSRCTAETWLRMFVFAIHVCRNCTTDPCNAAIFGCKTSVTRDRASMQGNAHAKVRIFI
jgi:hypothetical protein